MYEFVAQSRIVERGKHGELISMPMRIEHVWGSDGVCAACGARRIFTPALELHHYPGIRGAPRWDAA